MIYEVSANWYFIDYEATYFSECFQLPDIIYLNNTAFTDDAVSYISIKHL